MYPSLMVGVGMIECSPSVFVSLWLFPRHSTDAVGFDGMPKLFAGVLVEGNDGVSFAANEADQFVPVEQRMRGAPPNRRLDLVVLDEVFRPNDLAILQVQTEEVTHRAEGEDLAA